MFANNFYIDALLIFPTYLENQQPETEIKQLVCTYQSIKIQAKSQEDRGKRETLTFRSSV